MGAAALSTGDGAQHPVSRRLVSARAFLPALYEQKILCHRFWAGSFLSPDGSRTGPLLDIRLAPDLRCDQRLPPVGNFDHGIFDEAVRFFQYQRSVLDPPLGYGTSGSCVYFRRAQLNRARSRHCRHRSALLQSPGICAYQDQGLRQVARQRLDLVAMGHPGYPAGARFFVAFPFGRSEEHTSELQSLAYLVCRLLLEKKKKHKANI